MIKSFSNKVTEQLWLTGRARKGFSADLKQRALDRLQALNAATQPETMRFPPSNNLEKLLGDRAGYWSVRLNKQWRLVFRFEGQDAVDVEIVDYH